MKATRLWPALLTVLLAAGCQSYSSGSRAFVPLFPQDGVPAGWTVRHWADVANPPESAASVWRVKDGILYAGEPRGTWFLSEQEYGNFELEFDFKLGPRGNSGCALRVPLKGDPAFDGVELQMADFRYNPEAKDSELTGGIYRAIAPRRQVYKPEQWNHYHITCLGSRIKAVLNGVLIQDVDLSTQNVTVKRHNGGDAVPLKDRPIRGHIGFQELSRENGQAQIRNARIKVLD
ncbi:MAG TPA: DUF1080 domain-containing protein [Verrucomicrobiae bacterium]|nr:DUF1080 domain-containing protein [Verrucomicrobiae bacterium]